MKKICLYTCITGNYDDLHEVEIVEKNVDYLCFTNNKNLKSNTWKIIYVEDETLDNQRLSRKIKMLGHPIISDSYDISVWMDASVVFNQKVTDFVKKYLKNNSFACFKHHARNCIYEEANECIKLKKDEKAKILKTVDFLHKENYPNDNVLYEMTVFIKKHNEPIVKKTMELWFYMVCNYSKRDQLSFMYCIWKTGMKIDDINLNVWNNEWFYCIKHNFKNKLDTCRIYYGKDNNHFDPRLDDQPKYKIKNGIYTIKSEVVEDTTVIEIELSDVPCVEYSKLQIEGIEINHINYFNTISYENRNIFYNKHGIIQLLGNFKKNQILSFSIEMRVLSNVEKIELIEYLSIQKIQKEDKIQELDEEVKNLRKEIEKIFNSKSWKITAPLRKITKTNKL